MNSISLGIIIGTDTGCAGSQRVERAVKFEENNKQLVSGMYVDRGGVCRPGFTPYHNPSAVGASAWPRVLYLPVYGMDGFAGDRSAWRAPPIFIPRGTNLVTFHCRGVVTKTVVFTLNRSFYLTSSAAVHPVSPSWFFIQLLILIIEIQILLWPETAATENPQNREWIKVLLYG